MNNDRRKQLDKAIQLLEDAKNVIENVMCEEQDSYENLPESLKESDNGERMSSNVDNLDSAMSSIDECIASINEATE